MPHGDGKDKVPFHIGIEKKEIRDNRGIFWNIYLANKGPAGHRATSLGTVGDPLKMRLFALC